MTNSEPSRFSHLVLVCTHKAYGFPEMPEIYRPIQVGSAPRISEDYFRDDTGDHIAGKNSTFCELTALYWAWKNLDAEVLGLCHYRRYFGRSRKQFLDRGDIEALLGQADVILPKKRHYWIETRESQYAHAHHAEDLRCVEEILREKYPDYLPDWQWMLGTRSGHIFNMFIMGWEKLDAYCAWLFDILFEAERRLDISAYSDKDRRVFGYLGERLLDVWIRKNGCKTAEVPVILTEKQHWLRKGFAFLSRMLKAKA